jgi:hypothetical protein
MTTTSSDGTDREAKAEARQVTRRRHNDNNEKEEIIVVRNQRQSKRTESPPKVWQECAL